VSLAQHLDARQPTPDILLAAIGQALEMAPDITLDTLAWTDETLTPTGNVVIRLDATLTPFDGNYRAAMQRIERFMHALQAVPNVLDVSLQSSPVNADSASTLSGKTFGADTLKETAARFSLSMHYREVGA